MIAIGFVGPSGTGKSYRAISVSKENDVDFLIDDGLLISTKNSRVIAGHSAKREPTKLASVRRALFVDSVHQEEVISAIEKAKPQKIMILGTSEQMVRKIASVLKLPEISYIINITDVASKEDIQEAVRIRKTEGKHIIPVPTFEIKKDFSGYFIDTLRTFIGKGKNQVLTSEKTVVRPTFSCFGKYHIAEKVLIAIAKKASEESPFINRTTKVTVDSYGDNGVVINMEIEAVYGENLVEAGRQAQKIAKTKIEELTGINVLFLNVCVKAVYLGE